MDYKTWFNKNFSLSLDGKFKGLDCVSNLPLFRHKLQRYLSGSNFTYSRVLGDSFVMRVSGQTCKLYFR